MKKRPYIKRDKLIKELQEIYNHLSDCQPKGDVPFAFILEDLHNLIQRLQGTYKTMEQRLAELASKHLTNRPEVKVKTVQYKFKKVKKE